MNHSNFETIEQEKAFKKTLAEFVKVVLFCAILLLVVAYASGFYKPSKTRIDCDLENVVLHQKLQAFEQDGHYFTSGILQSDDFAHSGRYSLKLTSEDPFGLNYAYPSWQGESFSITVWRFAESGKTKQGSLVASVDGGRFWKQGTAVVEKQENGWEKIELKCTPPQKCMNKTIKIYCWNAGQVPIYFDDLHIEVNTNEEL